MGIRQKVGFIFLIRNISSFHQRGFTLVESLLSLVIAALMGITLVFMLRLGIDSFSMVVERKNTLSDARLAVDRIIRELLLIENSDILVFSPVQIRFRDTTGAETEFRTETNGDVLRLFRGENILADQLSVFSLTYFDGNDVQLTTFNDPSTIRRIRVEMGIQSGQNLGTLTVRGEVVPRSVFYTNFQ